MRLVLSCLIGALSLLSSAMSYADSFTINEGDFTFDAIRFSAVLTSRATASEAERGDNVAVSLWRSGPPPRRYHQERISGLNCARSRVDLNFSQLHSEWCNRFRDLARCGGFSGRRSLDL